MLKHTLRLLALVFTLGLPTAAHAADCTWSVSGKLAVYDTETGSSAALRPLVGVSVQVAATTFSWGAFTVWDTVETDHTGRFVFTERKSCADRRFRVWAKFDNADLQVMNGDGGEWMLLRDDPSAGFTRHRPSIDLGTFTYQYGAAGLFGSPRTVRRAIAWSVATRLMDWLEARDPWLAFGRKLHIKYPANTASKSSWAAIDTVYIHGNDRDDHWDVLTLMHEIGHIWNYDHNSGVTNWLSAVLWDFSTHGAQEHPSIAFHEGFAEFFAEEMLATLGGGDAWHGNYYAPFATPDAVQRNDIAVASALGLVRAVTPLADMLVCFRGNAALGWPKDLELGGTDNGLLMYLDRCNDLLGSFTDAEYASVLDSITR